MKELIKKLLLRFKRFITYGIVGCINTVVDFLVFTLMNTLVGLSPAWSQAVGYMTGVCTSFILNRGITFRGGKNKLRDQLIRFAAVNGLSLLASTQLIRFLTEQDFNELLANTTVAKIAVTFVVMIINYFGYKLLVFGVNNNGNEEETET